MSTEVPSPTPASTRGGLKSSQSSISTQRGASPRAQTDSVPLDDIERTVIAIIGSSFQDRADFIRSASGKSSLETWPPSTAAVRATQTKLFGLDISLLNMAWFEDNFDITAFKSNMDVLECIATHLSASYKGGVRLRAIIYLHRIEESPSTDVQRNRFSMALDLCGLRAMKNVVLVTSGWKTILHTKHEGLERELTEERGLFKVALENGARMYKFHDSVVSAQNILHYSLENHATSLRIQRQLVEEKMDLWNTSVALALRSNIFKCDLEATHANWKADHSTEIFNIENHDDPEGPNREDIYMISVLDYLLKGEDASNPDCTPYLKDYRSSSTPFSDCVQHCTSEQNMHSYAIADLILRTMQKFHDDCDQNTGERALAKQMLLKFSQSVSIVPSSLFVRGLSRAETFASLPREGGYAGAFCASMNGRDVAVKQLCKYKYANSRGEWRRPLYREAFMWRQLRHPCILEFIGLDAETYKDSICIVSPWMKKGDLCEYLSVTSNIGVAQKAEWIRGVLCGLSFLHQEGVIHGDLCCANIFLGSDLRPYVGGLAQSFVVNAGLSATRRQGAIRWMAPEVIESGDCTAAGDIYSFGCVCLEIISGKHPFSDLSTSKQVRARVLRTRHPEWDDNFDTDYTAVRFRAVANRCWAKSPSSRPNAHQLMLELLSTAGRSGETLKVQKHLELTPASHTESTIYKFSSSSPPLGRTREDLYMMLVADYLLRAGRPSYYQYMPYLEGLRGSKSPFSDCVRHCTGAKSTFILSVSDLLLCTMQKLYDDCDQRTAEAKLAKQVLLTFSENINTFPSSLFVPGAGDSCDDSSRQIGTYADVYCVSTRAGKFAVKRLWRYDHADPKSDWRRRFFREALLWRQLTHPSILEFVGIDTNTFKDSICLVSVWMSNGDLSKYLASNRNTGMPQRTKWIQDILCGLQFLHEEGLTHGDLRCANTLLDGDLRVYIADFGLSMLLKEGVFMHEGAVRWAAPEVIGSGKCTAEGDIYAFGCVCLEVMSGRPPLPDLLDRNQIISSLRRGERPKWPDILNRNSIAERLGAVAARCWSDDVSSRPSAPQLMVELRFLADYTVEPNSLQEHGKGVAHANEDVYLVSVIDHLLKVDPIPGYTPYLNDFRRSDTPFSACIRHCTGDQTATSLAIADLILCTMQKFHDDCDMYTSQRKFTKRMLLKFSQKVGAVPSSLFVPGAPNAYDDSSRRTGAYADVYPVSINGQKFALKRLRHYGSEDSDGDWRRPFHREALLWRQLRHPSILEFIGIDADTFKDSICMVSPWMANGDLSRYLTSNRNPDMAQKVQWIRDVLSALSYLHNEKVVHGDLRGANILLDDNLRACIADFGLSFLVDAGLSTMGFTTKREGAVRWMAPEVIDSGECTTKGDMYSFGCVCLEIMSGKCPLPDLVNDKQVISRLGRGERPKWPDALNTNATATQLGAIARSCWVDVISSRPDAHQLIAELKSL